MQNYKIRLCEETITKRELYELSEWIVNSDRLTKGELTSEFESKFSEFIGNKYSVFVNSGSSANLLMLYSILYSKSKVKKCVIAPAISWSTTIAPAMQLGFDIKLCDCNMENLGFDLNHFETLCKDNPNSIAILVHVLGHPVDLDEIVSISNKYSITLLEDSCESLGSRYKNKSVGTFGLASSFSLYYSHQISTIEGGVVSVNDKSLYEILLSLRSHGWSRDISPQTMKSWENEFNVDEFMRFYSFYFPGFNFRPTEINSFLGLSQLKILNEVVKNRQSNFEYYVEKLGSDFWVQKSDYTNLSCLAFSTLIKNRLEVYQKLRNTGIESRPLVAGNIGRQPFWIKEYGEERLKNADIIHDHGIYLPNHQNLSKSQLDYIINKFIDIAIPL